MFKTAHARRLPVLEDKDLAGIISVDDLLLSLVTEFGAVMSPVVQELVRSLNGALAGSALLVLVAGPRGRQGTRVRRPRRPEATHDESFGPGAALPDTEHEEEGCWPSSVPTPPTSQGEHGLVTSLR